MAIDQSKSTWPRQEVESGQACEGVVAVSSALWTNNHLMIDLVDALEL